MALRLESTCLYGAFLCCLLIQGCLPSQHSRQSPMFAMSDVTNDLGVCALQLLAHSMPGRNIAFSPYGLASVSMLLYEGSAGNTAHQLQQALRLPYDGLYARVGFRDLYRHLRSYFMSDGFLKGLVLSHENVCIRADYMRVLAFYGFDLPEHSSVEPCNNTTSSTLRPSTSSFIPSSSSTFSTQPSSAITSSTNPSSGVTTSTNSSPSTSSTVSSNPSSAITDSNLSSTTSTTSSGFTASTKPSSALTSGTSIPSSSVIPSSTDPASTNAPSAISSTMSMSLTTSEGPISTISPAMENKETPGLTESISETTPPMTTVNSVASTSATSQGTEPTVLEQLTSMTTEPADVKTTQPMVTNEMTTNAPSTDTTPSKESTINLINMEMTTNLNGESLVTTVSPNNGPATYSTNTNRIPDTTVLDGQTNPMEVTTNGAVENIISTLSNKIGTGESIGSVTTPMNSIDKVDTTVLTNVNSEDMETTVNVADVTTQPYIPNVETSTTLNNVDSGNILTTLVTPMSILDATTPNIELVTSMNNIETTTRTSQQSIGTTESVSIESTTMMIPEEFNNNAGITTISNLSSVTIGSPMTTVNMEQMTNFMESTQTTPGNKNDKLSTIVEVTVLPPSTINPQLVGEQDGSATEGPIDSTTPDSSNDKLSTMLEETPPTTISPNDPDIPTTVSNVIVFNTTPSNKNDKLSTIVEVTVTPPSTVNTEVPENTEIPTTRIPEVNTTETIDTTIPTTPSTVDYIPNQQATSEPSTGEPNEETTVNNTPTVRTLTPLITESSDSETNKNNSKSVEALEPASSVNTLVQHNETLLDNPNPDDQVQLINSIVEDSLAAYIPPQNGAYIDIANPNKDSLSAYLPPKNGAYVDQAKPNKASVVLNYDYLNPENFQDYVNIVEKSANNNDSEPDFMDAVMQDAVRRNKSLVSSFMDNNQVRYTYETYVNDYNHNLNLRGSRSIAYETPLLHKIKSWIKYKSGYDQIDPFTIAHITPSFEPSLAGFVPTFAAKSGDYPLPGGYSQPSGTYLPNGGSYAQPNQNYLPSNGNYAQSNGGFTQSGGSYSQTNQNYLPNGENYAQANGGFTQSSQSYLLTDGDFAQSGGSYPPNGGSYSQSSGGYSSGTYSPPSEGSYSPSSSYLPSGSHQTGDSQAGGGIHQTGSSHQSTGGSSHPGEIHQSGDFHQTGSPHQSTGGSSHSGGIHQSGDFHQTGSHQSTGRPSHPPVTPSYEPPYASYVNKMPEDLDWFLANGRARIVPVMRYSAVLPYAYVAPLDAFALEIPLDDEKYKLLILLPSSSYGLSSLLKALPYCSIRAIYSQLRYVSVYATLPVFDVVEQISLTPTLQQLGVSDIFDISKADLSSMSSDSNLFVRDIMQVVAIYAKKYNSGLVHEVPTHSTQTTFTASHSFVYFVVDNFTKVALLAGIVEDPARKH